MRIIYIHTVASSGQPCSNPRISRGPRVQWPITGCPPDLLGNARPSPGGSSPGQAGPRGARRGGRGRGTRERTSLGNPALHVILGAAMDADPSSCRRAPCPGTTGAASAAALSVLGNQGAPCEICQPGSQSHRRKRCRT